MMETNQLNPIFLKISLGLMGLAVILGAFGAHYLKTRLDVYSLGVFEKAVFYQIIHALALLCIFSLAAQGLLTVKTSQLVSLCFICGILFFSGSLYCLALTQLKFFGAITPVGGVLFITGWLLALLRS